MRVLYFGTYSIGSGYPRNQLLIKGLRSCGTDVSECHVDLWNGAEHKARVASRTSSFLRFLPSLAFAWVKLTLKFLNLRRDYDVMIVGYMGHLDIFLARLLNRGRPLIFDAFLSLREAVVEDRRLFRDGGILDNLMKWFDKTAASLADLVLLDTNAHIDYFCSLTSLPRRKFCRVFVGEDEETFAKTKHRPIFPPTVLYFGTYLPFHGVDTILRAAKLLEDLGLTIELIGNGPEYPRARKLAEKLALENVRFSTDWIEKDELARKIALSTICLGVFGNGSKTQRVIPCKVFPALAMAKPLITVETPAVSEALVHLENAYLVPATNPRVLAYAIRTLLSDKQLMTKIGEGGANLFRENFSSVAIGYKLLKNLEKVCIGLDG